MLLFFLVKTTYNLMTAPFEVAAKNGSDEKGDARPPWMDQPQEFGEV